MEGDEKGSRRAGATLGQVSCRLEGISDAQSSDEYVQMWHFCDFWRGAPPLFFFPSTSNMTSWISVPPRVQTAVGTLHTVAVLGMGWAGLGHPQRSGCEARAEATDHFRLSPTTRSTQFEVDLSMKLRWLDLEGPGVRPCRKIVAATTM